MKKIISVLIITAMMLSSLMLAGQIFAEEIIDTPDAAPEVTPDAVGKPTEDLPSVRDSFIESINTANSLILTDYTDETAEALSLAIEAAESILEDESADYDSIFEAMSMLDDALIRLEAKKADTVEIKALYNYFKYSNTKKTHNQVELSAAIEAAEAALSNSKLLISEAEAVVAMLESVSTLKSVSTPEEFMAMESDGSYILANNITLIDSYGEFSGYLYGDGYTVTVAYSSIFDTLDGATVSGFSIKGSDVGGVDSFAPLSRAAKGSVTVSDVTNYVKTIMTDNGTVASGFILQGEGADIKFINCVNNANILGGTAAGFYAINASGTNNLHFYNCVNNGIIFGRAIAGGFVADTGNATSENILFEYCLSSKNVCADGIASAFFGAGKGNVEMYGCVVGGVEPIEVSFFANDKSVGGVIGYVEEGYGIDIFSCYFNIDLIADDQAALVFGAAEGVYASCKELYVVGNVVASTDNAYRLTALSNENLTLDTVLLDVSLKIDLNGEISENPNAVGLLPKIDFSAFDEYSVKEMNAGVTAFVNASISGADADKKIEITKIYAESLRMLKTPEEAELESAKNGIREIIDILFKGPEGYTAESYAEYIANIEKIKADIDGARSIEALELLGGVNAISVAESKLVTLLDDAKANALHILSAKRENAGKVFTPISYKIYLSEYDLIVEKINSAESLEALRAINVPLLKVEAESKLEVNIPIEVDEEDDVIKENENVKENDDNEQATEQIDDSSESRSGCESTVAMSAIATVGVIGLACACKKKKTK